MTEYRFGRPEDEADILDFINLVFSQSARPHHFDRLLPKVYAHPGFGPLHALAVKDGRIRGTIALLPLEVHLAGKTLKGGYIGSVSVHEKARGEGHMKRLMAMQTEAARQQGMDFMALGGRRQRYGYFGFETVGGRMDFSITADNVRHALGNTDDAWVYLRPLERPDDPDLPAVQALHDEQLYFCRRDAGRLYDTLRSWEAQPYVIAAGDAVRGYMTANDDTIFELVLEDSGDLPAVIKAWMRDKKHGTVTVPLWDRQQADALRAFAENCDVGDYEMLRILNWPRVLQCAMEMKWVCQAMAEGRRVLDIAGQKLALEVNGEDGVAVSPADETPHRVLTEKEATALFFSPYAALMEEDPVLRSWLPLPLYIPVPDQF